jgi:hypothetical protein
MFNLVFDTLVKHYSSPGVFGHDGNPNDKPVDVDPVGMTLILSTLFLYLVVSSLVNSSRMFLVTRIPTDYT